MSNTIKPDQNESLKAKDMEGKQEVYLNILSDPIFAESVGDSLIDSDPDMRSIAESIKLEAINESENHGDKQESFGTVTLAKLGVGIARALARFAVDNDHQIVPTFEEEIFRSLEFYGVSVKTVAADHWRLVKKHAKECFDSDSSGFKLVSKLIDYQKHNPNYTIHTISHSAGAIPTARLLEALNKKNYQIDSANLIVPAINQKEFKKLVLPNLSAVKKYNAYVLSQKEEEIDSIAFGAYPASLLYFVSGLADDAWYGDQMLLLEQHLSPTRRAYRSKTYLWLVKEKPKQVWSHIKNNPDSWFFYPGNLAYEDNLYSKRASHECTKYPWIATEVGKNIINQITNVEVESIPTPTVPTSKVAKANRTCL